MAKHKTRSLRGSAIIVTALAACAALLFTVVGSTSAGAAPVAPGKKASVKNSVVTGICNFTAQEYNPSTSEVGIRLAAQAQPTGLLGYARNVYTQMFCTVLNSSGVPVASFNPYVDGPYLANTATQTVVPYSSVYYVCATGFVKLSNGNQSLTPTVCV